MNHATIKSAVESAKRQVIASGRVNRWAFVVRDRDDFGRDRLEVMSGAEYEETGDEDKCVASVWSYADGHYDGANVFHENGKIAAAVEFAD